jgi:hypothetical protein
VLHGKAGAMVGQRIRTVERVNREVGLREPALRQQRPEHIDRHVATLDAFGEVDLGQPAGVGPAHACRGFALAGLGGPDPGVRRTRLLHGVRQREGFLGDGRRHGQHGRHEQEDESDHHAR